MDLYLIAILGVTIMTLLNARSIHRVIKNMDSMLKVIERNRQISVDVYKGHHTKNLVSNRQSTPTGCCNDDSGFERNVKLSSRPFKPKNSS